MIYKLYSVIVLCKLYIDALVEESCCLKREFTVNEKKNDRFYRKPVKRFYSSYTKNQNVYI